MLNSAISLDPAMTISFCSYFFAHLHALSSLQLMKTFYNTMDIIATCSGGLPYGHHGSVYYQTKLKDVTSSSAVKDPMWGLCTTYASTLL